jgi:hypothetical protein
MAERRSHKPLVAGSIPASAIRNYRAVRLDVSVAAGGRNRIAGGRERVGVTTGGLHVAVLTRSLPFAVRLLVAHICHCYKAVTKWHHGLVA